MSTSSTAAARTNPVDWRAELRRKLQKHARAKGIVPKSDEEKLKRPVSRRVPAKKGEEANPVSAAPPSPTTPRAVTPANPIDDPRPEANSEVVRELFRYRLEDVEQGEEKPKIVTFAKARPQPGPLDKPLIRKPVKATSPIANPGAAPEQKSLALESPGATAAASPEPGEEPEELEPRLELISVEVLLSRFLAFIVDLTISLGAGFLFAFLGSRASGAAFPTTDSLVLAASCGVLFLVLTSSFFLFATGQTWGMLCTDLRLRGEEKESPGFVRILARTLLFFPVLLTVVGLVSALFDPLRRCWHDRLTNTFVVPSSFPK